MARQVVFVRLENAKEIDRFLVAAIKEYGPNNAMTPLRAFIRKRVSVAVGPLKAVTPVKQGHLKASVQVRSYKFKQLATVGAIVGYRDLRSNKVRLPQILASEFGNKRQKPFAVAIERTFRAVSPKIIAETRATFGPFIERRLRLLARRKARGKLRFR